MWSLSVTVSGPTPKTYNPPTTADEFRARKVVSQYLPETPLVRSEHLSAALDADVYLKREDTLPTGAFKVRGGVTLVDSLDDEFRDRGLVTASSGNHGLSIAWAGREFGVPVTIGVPEDANAGKVAAMERLGADVVPHGPDYDAAREHVEELAVETGKRYVHSGNEPKLLAGVGETLTGRLLLFDAADMSFDEVPVRANPDCPVCGDDPVVESVHDVEYAGTCAVGAD